MGAEFNQAYSEEAWIDTVIACVRSSQGVPCVDLLDQDFLFNFNFSGVEREVDEQVAVAMPVVQVQQSSACGEQRFSRSFKFKLSQSRLNDFPLI